MTRQLLHLTIEIVDLLLDSLARREQGPDRGDQLGTPLASGELIPLPSSGSIPELPHVDKRFGEGQY